MGLGPDFPLWATQITHVSKTLKMVVRSSNHLLTTCIPFQNAERKCIQTVFSGGIFPEEK